MVIALVDKKAVLCGGFSLTAQSRGCIINEIFDKKGSMVYEF